jgi:tetratricopeptide (TPR) repeat protein
LEPLLKANPSSDVLLNRLGDTYTYTGQPERGIELLRRGLQLNPRSATYPHAFIARGLLLLNRYDEVVTEINTCIELAPGFRPCQEIAAVIYAELGRHDEAHVAAMEAHRLDRGSPLLPRRKCFLSRIHMIFSALSTVYEKPACPSNEDYRFDFGLNSIALPLRL